MRRARPLKLRTRTGRSGWLILAPHPDDETLGAGGLIAALAEAREDLTVAFLTDGSGSHPDTSGWSPRRVAHARAGEARNALRRLGFRPAPIFLDWQDGAPYSSTSLEFEKTVRKLTHVCRTRKISRIVAAWQHEPHCDHEAAAQVARAVAGQTHAQLLDYLVWGWTLADADERLSSTRAFSLSLGQSPARVRKALAAHRTQLGGRIPAGGRRFVLPRSLRRLTDVSHVLLLENRHAP